jgi:hypothetical protein
LIFTAPTNGPLYVHWRGETGAADLETTIRYRLREALRELPQQAAAFSSQTELAQSRMLIRPPAQWPEELAIAILDR